MALYFYSQVESGGGMQLRNTILAAICGVVCIMLSLALGTPNIRETNEHNDYEL